MAEKNSITSFLRPCVFPLKTSLKADEKERNHEGIKERKHERMGILNSQPDTRAGYESHSRFSGHSRSSCVLSFGEKEISNSITYRSIIDRHVLVISRHCLFWDIFWADSFRSNYFRPQIYRYCLSQFILTYPLQVLLFLLVRDEEKRRWVWVWFSRPPTLNVTRHNGQDLESSS